ncbi:MAG: CNNM domain-containing protein [Opitutales bacterium]
MLAVAFTLGVSAFCSMLEAMILSTSTAEIEALKQRLPPRGLLLERYKEDIEGTTSAILTLNTVANTLGATLVGVLAYSLWGESQPVVVQWVVPLSMTLGILVLSEILPKNIGVLYRPSLQPLLVYPLAGVRWITGPVSKLAGGMVRFALGSKASGADSGDEQEIKLLAERSAEEGNLTSAEMAIITNALSLDDLRVHEIMTPRTVVEAVDAEETVASVFERSNNIPFARLPVYEESIDKVVGLVRRRELLKAMAEGRENLPLRELMQPVTFLPEHASGIHALQQFLRSHQQLAVVVDEFGSVCGVVTMEDMMEHLLGQEIFEKDDIAIDMRELARRRERVRLRKRQREKAVRQSA